MSSKVSSKTASAAVKHVNKFFLIPSIVAAGLIPLIVRLYTYDTTLEQFDWWADSSATQTDVFLAWKSFFIIGTAIVMGALLIYRAFSLEEKLPWHKSYWLWMIYGLFVLLSGIFSKYKHLAFSGSYERFESVFVILGYLVIAYYTLSCMQTEEHFWFFLKGVTIFVLIEVILGIFQGLGLDFFATNFGKMLISQSKYWSDLSVITITMPEKAVYGTLYHPDYSSLYFGLIIPVYLAAVLAAKGKKKIFWAVVLVLSVIDLALNIKGLGVISGAIGIVGAFIVLAYILASRKKVPFIILIAAAVVVIVIAAAGGVFSRFASNTAGTVIYSGAVSEIGTEDDEAVLYLTDGREIHITYAVDDAGNMTVSCHDKDGNEISTELTDADNQIYNCTDPDYSGLSFARTSGDSVYYLKVTYDGHEWPFYIGPDGTYYYINYVGKMVKTHEIEVSDAFPYGFANARGLIWDRIIPLLKHTVFLGTGANTLTAVYPQDDYVFKTYSDWPYDVKAHSFYLQQLLENGWVGSFALFAFLIIEWIRGIMIIRRSELKKGNIVLYIGLMTGIMSYLIVGLANDSMVVTAPVFWTLLGIYMAFTMFLDKEKTPVKADSRSDTNPTVKTDNRSDKTRSVKPDDTSSKSSLSETANKTQKAGGSSAGHTSSKKKNRKKR